MKNLFDDFMEELRRRQEALAAGRDPDAPGPEPDRTDRDADGDDRPDDRERCRRIRPGRVGRAIPTTTTNLDRSRSGRRPEPVAGAVRRPPAGPGSAGRMTAPRAGATVPVGS